VSLALHAAAGFAAPASGSVLVGGKELAAHDEEMFRRSVVLIPNEPELFDGTLLENLTMFDPARELKAREWADRLDLTDLIGRLPHGFLTKYRCEIVSPINDGVVRRLALARALSLEPKVLMVDHGFHNIDQPGERKIAELLASLRGKMTILIASDRAIFRDLATRRLEIKVQKIADERKEAAVHENGRAVEGDVPCREAALHL
jgi:ATP-binding cassette, subfamily C, bacterial LapB